MYIIPGRSINRLVRKPTRKKEDEMNTTLGDILKFVKSQEISFNLFGVTGKYRRGFDNFCRALGRIIAKEHGKTMEGAQDLPEDTELGKEAQIKFLRLQLWVLKNK